MRPSSPQPGLVEATQVPLVDRGSSNGGVRERILDRISQAIDRGDFTNGHSVAQFKRQPSHRVGLSNGLDALGTSLVASGPVPDERASAARR